MALKFHLACRETKCLTALSRSKNLKDLKKTISAINWPSWNSRKVFWRRSGNARVLLKFLENPYTKAKSLSAVWQNKNRLLVQNLQKSYRKIKIIIKLSEYFQTWHNYLIQIVTKKWKSASKKHMEVVQPQEDMHLILLWAQSWKRETSLTCWFKIRLTISKKPTY